jgi:FixJ family two-component response regulator
MSAEQSSHNPRSKQESADSPVVCVIDDDASLLRAVTRLLTASGFRVRTFPSAETFLGSVTCADAACLVVDVHLGGLSGFELQERLAAEGCRVPTLFITGRDDATTRERARLAGAVDYLSKPFDETRLLAAIHRALDRS